MRLIEQFKPRHIQPYSLHIPSPVERAIKDAVESMGLRGEDAAIKEYELLVNAGVIEEHPCTKDWNPTFTTVKRSCRCNQCGSFVYSESNYCQNCGHKMETQGDDLGGTID